MADKDPITSHVLNTVTGRPAADMRVRLTLVEPQLGGQVPTFLANTNADGRVLKWEPEDKITVAEIIDEVPEGRLLWNLRYDVETFYGEGKTLFKVVELTVYQDVTKQSGPGHLHVPLLLGPWSYTTYRGS